MYKRRARQQKLLRDKENSHNESLLQAKEERQQENQPGKKQQQEKPFYLIVEAAARESSTSDRSQYWLISSKNIVDIPVINTETVYTGKQLRFQLADNRFSSGTCVLFSADFSFVQAQFQQITCTMDADKTLKSASPKVLNNSTKGNILGAWKGPVKVATKSVVKKEPQQATDNLMMEIPVVLGDPDSENKPPGQRQEILTIHGGGGGQRAMMYDQQSQTDSKMWTDTVVPATAAQMQQQSSQLAQLIRANNGLVQELKTVKETNQDIKDTVEELKSKLDETLALLRSVASSKRDCPPPTSTGTTSSQPTNHFAELNCNDSMASATSVTYEVTCSRDTSVDQYASYSNLSSIVPSREQSVARSTKSENTPPLKKNKAKLNNSLRLAQLEPKPEYQELQQEIVEEQPIADDMLSIGDNGTQVPKSVFNTLKYENYSSVTRKILASVFDRSTLASHSLTGKPSPAFLERGAKHQLDPKKIADIIKYVSESCNVLDSAVRGVITSKCADENKMMRLHAKKRQSVASDEVSEVASKRRQTMYN